MSQSVAGVKRENLTYGYMARKQREANRKKREEPENGIRNEQLGKLIIQGQCRMGIKNCKGR